MKLLVIAVLTALPLTACTAFGDIAKNPNCVVRGSGKTNFGGGMPTGEARYSFTCNAVQKTTEPLPPAPPAPDDVKPPPT